MRCFWPIGLSLDTMLPDVCSKHVLACMVKVYMSCVVSTPQTPVLDNSLTNYNSTGIDTQTITSSSDPTL